MEFASSLCPTASSPNIAHGTDSTEADKRQASGLRDGAQQKGIGLAESVDSHPHDSPAVVDRKRRFQGPSRAGVDEAVQVDHGPVAVEKGVIGAAGCVGIA